MNNKLVIAFCVLEVIFATKPPGLGLTGLHFLHFQKMLYSTIQLLLYDALLILNIYILHNAKAPSIL